MQIGDSQGAGKKTPLQIDRIGQEDGVSGRALSKACHGSEPPPLEGVELFVEYNGQRIEERVGGNCRDHGAEAELIACVLSPCRSEVSNGTMDEKDSACQPLRHPRPRYHPRTSRGRSRGD